MRAARAGGLLAPRLPLVAGGSGQLGRHMLQALANAGCTRARVLDVRPPQQPTAGLEVEFTRHKLGHDSPAALRAALQGVDSVFSMVTSDVEHATEEELMRTNATGVQDLLDASAAGEPERFVLISSTAVTGLWAPSVQQNEEEPLPPPSEYRWAYEVSKRKGEDAALAADGGALATVVLRPHQIISGCRDVGFRQAFDFPGTVVMPAEAAAQDFIAAQDLCRAALLAEERLDSVAVRGQAFFVSKGQESTIQHVGKLLADELGWTFTGLPPVAMSCIGFGREVRHRALMLLQQPVAAVSPQAYMAIAKVENTFDNTRAAHTLGFEPSVGLEEAVAAVAAEYRQSTKGSG